MDKRLEMQKGECELKKMRIFVLGLLIGAVTLFSIPGMAKNTVDKIEAVYCDIKLVVNGKNVVPKDADGKEVEPFIYNGTTYLPVRAVADALGKEVTWNGDTKTVSIGGEPSLVIIEDGSPTSLNDIPYSAISSADSVTFSNGETSSIQLFPNLANGDDGRVYLIYDKLNFNRFTCRLLPPDTTKNVEISYIIKCYGKINQEKTYNLIKSSKPIDVDIPIEKGNRINIEAYIFNGDKSDNSRILAEIQEPTIWQ